MGEIAPPAEDRGALSDPLFLAWGRTVTGRRPRVRRRSRSRRKRDEELLLLGVGVALAVGVVPAVFSWLAENWWVPLALGLICAGAGGGWLYRLQQRRKWERVQQQALRFTLPQLDALHHRAFEYAIRDLMRRDGCADARQIGGAGDNGADVLATDPMGRTWVIQVKHRKDGVQGSAVGTPDLQRVNGTARQLYGADIVLVVTNGRFSTRCAPLATRLQMHLADRQTLATWAGGARPLWELLPRIPRPRRGR